MEPQSPNRRVVPFASIEEGAFREFRRVQELRREREREGPAGPPDKVGAGDPDETVVELRLRDYGVGIDCHSKFFAVCAFMRAETGYRQFTCDVNADFHDLQAAGQEVKERLRRAGVLPPGEAGEASFTYTFESTGCYHVPLMLAWQGAPCLVNPSLASPTRRKTDRLDARLLAYHALTGLWPASFVAWPELQALRVVLMSRRHLQRESTAALNRLNNVLLRFGHTFGNQGSLASPRLRPIVEDLAAGKAMGPLPGLSPIPLPAAVRVEVTQILKEYDRSRVALKESLKRAETLVKSLDWPSRDRRIPGEEMLALLRTVPGVGIVGSLTWLAEASDPNRFPCAKAACAFAGCDASLKVSAGKVTSHARRRGNAVLHHAMVQSGQSLVSKGKEPLGQWGRRIWLQGRKGGYFRAVAATARRVVEGLYWVHLKGEPFCYDGYRLEVPQVPDVPVEEMGFSPRVSKLLEGLGLGTSQQVVDAWQGRLRQNPGVGKRTIEEVAQWVQENRLRQARPEAREKGAGQ